MLQQGETASPGPKIEVPRAQSSPWSQKGTETSTLLEGLQIASRRAETSGKGGELKGCWLKTITFLADMTV